MAGAGGYLADDGDSFDQPPPIRLSPWPQHALVAISALGLLVAAFHNPLWCFVAYLVVLIAGSSLLYYDRIRIIAASRDGSGGAKFVSRYDQVAVALLLAACLANGVVVAWEAAKR